MTNWTKIASVDELPPGGGKELAAGGRVIALFNVDGTIYALDGVCPHAGGPLGQGDLDGCIVTCPWHGWQFDVSTGRHSLNPGLQHATIPVRVDGQDVYVDVDGN